MAKTIGSRNLSPEFKAKFVMKIGGGGKGKEAVLYNGLLALAHADERFGHVRAYITQYPTVENKWTAFARAEIYDIKGTLIGMEEADASAANCGKMTAASFPRMACTRAKGRALRDFLNVGLVTTDEVNEVYEPEYATSKQLNTIKRMGKEMSMPKNDLLDFVEDLVGTDILNELTEPEAELVISELEKKAGKKKKLQKSDEEDEEFDFSGD